MRNVKRTTVVLAGLAGLVMSAAACADPGPAPTGGSSAPAPASAPATSPAPAGGGNAAGGGNPSGAGGGAGTKAGAATGSGGHTGATATVRECRTSDLRVSLVAVPGTYAGSALRHADRLVFTNVSGRSCFEQGYPGVSFVAGDNGTQVGRGFIRDSATTPRVTLKAGGQAHATIVVTDAPNACRPVQVRGFRVMPPDQVTSVFVSRPQDACRDTGQSGGHVQPITKGA
ncbi:DUF4232 domain-containing protein [Paractinoplanes maris]|uniref:DUF4232 domain-containing protein n=1 Tax=Paractinoplanes maris TaxID=1734446 RepID=UPI0020215F62|nr:DUF4232 domain-containing protein [Actinoplanes maris]